MSFEPGAEPPAAASPLRGQILRFAVVGAAATLTHVVAALALHEGPKLSPLWANFAAFSAAVLVSYFGHRGWTFAVEGQHGVQLPRFVFIALAGLALNQTIVYLTVEIIQWPFSFALAFVVLVVPGLSFLLIRHWVFPTPA